MRLQQGTFSFLPDLSDDQIERQVDYILRNGWLVSIEYTDEPHPYNNYWHMWSLPMFDLTDSAAVMYEFRTCREAFPRHYIKINGFDPSPMWQAQRVSFIAYRPTPEEPGFRLNRTVWSDGRMQKYGLQPYAEDKPSGERY